MIKRLFFEFGPFGASDPLVLEPSAMTVFVGPNNSGKSLVLKELQQYAEQGRTAQRKIVEGIEIEIPSVEDAKCLLQGRQSRVPPTATLPVGHIHVSKLIPSGGSAHHRNINLDWLVENIPVLRSRQQQGMENWWRECPDAIYSQFTSLFTVALDGKTRLALTEERAAGDLQAAPANHLAALFQQDEARERVRRIAHEAFGLYFVIDPTNSGKLRIRMSDRPPDDNVEEQALDERARRFHGEATDIAQLSDGVKAFAGLISALISSDYKIMLVDEPEAFLHPSLAEQLGREMATLADERKGNVFTATHSSRFLMGCVESGKPTNIVRLTYKAPHATARALPAERIEELMRDPLLRSTDVLEALFYSGAVVCEADKDRAFYGEVNNRLQAENRNFIPDTVFLNAQNKQTVRRIVGPLRQMGIPAAAIVDFDVIKGNSLRELLKECFIPQELIQSLGQLRGNVEGYFDSNSLDMKQGGISQLSDSMQEACQSLIEKLAEYGIFVVPQGEVESWLSGLGVNASKSNWLPAMFERMRSDPHDPAYVRPGQSDVWEFLERVAEWIRDDERRGMPRPQHSEVPSA